MENTDTESTFFHGRCVPAQGILSSPGGCSQAVWVCPGRHWGKRTQTQIPMTPNSHFILTAVLCRVVPSCSCHRGAAGVRILSSFSPAWWLLSAFFNMDSLWAAESKTILLLRVFIISCLWLLLTAGTEDRTTLPQHSGAPWREMLMGTGSWKQ